MDLFIDGFFYTDIMRQSKTDAAFICKPLTNESICKDVYRWILPDKLNTHYMFNGELKKPHNLMYYDLSTNDTTIASTGRDGYIYSFIDGESMRVQYNNPCWENETSVEHLYFGCLPAHFVNTLNDGSERIFNIWCFDGMFDSFFNRTKSYGVDIHRDDLSRLQLVKHITFDISPCRVLSMNEMFRNLPNLETIDMRSWEIPPWCLDDPNFHPFVNCPKLREVRINDNKVTTEHLYKWLRFNFDNLNNRSPITADTIAAYNAHKYVFNRDLHGIANRRQYNRCYDKELASYGNPSMDMNEMANWFRVYGIFSSTAGYGPYNWHDRGLHAQVIDGIPYYDAHKCHIINPINKVETINDRITIHREAVDVYSDRWYAVPPKYTELGLTERDWSKNIWEYFEKNRYGLIKEHIETAMIMESFNKHRETIDAFLDRVRNV